MIYSKKSNVYYCPYCDDYTLLKTCDDCKMVTKKVNVGVALLNFLLRITEALEKE